MKWLFLMSFVIVAVQMALSVGNYEPRSSRAQRSSICRDEVCRKNCLRSGHVSGVCEIDRVSIVANNRKCKCTWKVSF